MSTTGNLRPHDPEFEPFLYASVGKDRNGSVVTVLSTLARLNLDPWKEAAELAALGREAARSRLGLLLSRVRDVPELGNEEGSFAQTLALLLPDRSTASTMSGGTTRSGAAVPPYAIWAILAIVFILVQILFISAPGSGE